MGDPICKFYSNLYYIMIIKSTNVTWSVKRVYTIQRGLVIMYIWNSISLIIVALLFKNHS